jgi:hypothetical protein
MPYFEDLDPGEQLGAEEAIAAYLFDCLGVAEGEANDAGKVILLMILERFRPDLIEDD